MIKKPETSVILPFYNAEKTILRALNSISKQTFINFECILVDNNSSDKSAEIANAYCKKDLSFKLKKKKKQGVTFASNTGYKKCIADYITRMDADDEMLPTSLEKRKKHLDKNKDIDVVCSCVEYIPHNYNTKGFQRYVNWSNSITSYKDIYQKRFIEAPIVNPSAMWRKSVSDKFGMYGVGDFPEDYEMWLRWLENDVVIEKLEHKLLKWYDSKERLTRTHPIYSDTAFFEIKTMYLAKHLKTVNAHYPKVAVWGASRISRNRAKLLTKNGIDIDFYIDIHNNRVLDRPVKKYTELNPQDQFILVYLKEEQARTKTVNWLQKNGFVENKHFLLVS